MKGRHHHSCTYRLAQAYVCQKVPQNFYLQLHQMPSYELKFYVLLVTK